MWYQNILQENQREYAYAFLLMGKSKSGDRRADGAAGAGIRTTGTGSTGAAATGSWLL